MSQITGYVKEIYEGTTKWGKPWWSITLDTGIKISTREPKFREEIEEGKEYTFTYESDGTYANITAPSVPVIHTDSETTSPDSTTAPQTLELPRRDTKPREFIEQAYKQVEKDIPKIYSSGNKDEAIRKAVALKAAVEFSDSVAGSTGNIKKIIEYAKEFEKYLEGNSGDDEDVPF